MIRGFVFFVLSISLFIPCPPPPPPPPNSPPLHRFPAGPLGIDINQKNGRIVVTASKGAAREGGVEEGDFLVQIGDAQLDDRLKDVDDAAKCKKVKEIVVSFPRPLRMVFAKPDAAILRSGGGDDDDDASVASSVATASSGKSKKRWSLFGKKGGSTGGGDGAAEAAATAAAEVKAEEEDEETDPNDGAEMLTATFEAGALGLSVTNRTKDSALVVTKASGQAAEHGVLVGDEIVGLNDIPCKGFKSDAFKKLIQQAGRPFDLKVTRGGGGGGDSSSSKKADDKKAKKEDDKKKKEDEKKKKKQAAEEEKERKRKEEEEAAEAEAAAEAEEEAREEKKREKMKKNLKKGDEVWYDDGEDWVEATILKLGDKLTLKLKDTGEKVPDVEKDWIAPMEYEDDENDDPEDNEEEEEEEEEEEADGMDMLAGMAVPGSSGKKKSKKEDKAAKEARRAAEREAAAMAKERAAREREARRDHKKASVGMRMPTFTRRGTDVCALLLCWGLFGHLVGTLDPLENSAFIHFDLHTASNHPSAKFMKKYQASLVDKEKAVDHLHRTFLAG